MEQFISPNSVKVKVKVDRKNINDFIILFNKKISQKKDCLNSAEKNVPALNDTEFKCVNRQAEKIGYKITKFNDNYQTKTYKLEKIKL